MTANEINNKFTFTKKLNEIPDTFNDKLDFLCKDFDDIKRLNKEMLNVAMKYKLFDGSKSSLEVLDQFKANFELLQVGLGELEQQLTNKEMTSNIQHQINELNKLLLNISNKEADISLTIYNK